MDQCTHEVRAQYWKEIIEACQQRPVGQSAKQWLKENGILEQSYYKWQRKFRKETFELMQATDLNVTPAQKNNISFAEISVKQDKTENCLETFVSPTAVIKTPSMTIAISNEISDSLLSRIMREVSADA
ncbi:MAG TPA: IS66 family insertion sequence element accessory protein TnpB [Lachnospiraceae bacterium]|nr:IS66 family insertion sequence element accessory protein TnpB [Lachnospiraceae bacterium]